MKDSHPFFRRRSYLLISGMLMFLGLALAASQWIRGWQAPVDVSCIHYSRLMALGCLMHARDYDEVLPATLEDLVSAGIVDERIYQEAMKLGVWDYRGKDRKTTEAPFVLGVLHVPAKRNMGGRDYWLLMRTDAKVEVTYGQPEIKDNGRRDHRALGGQGS